MSGSSNRPIRIELIVQSLQPQLLEGLEAWLQLGLLSDLQVRGICQQHLSCPIPEPEVVDAPAQAKPKRLYPEANLPQSSTPTSPTSPALLPQPALTATRSSPPDRSSASSGLVVRGLQAFMAEVSVLWLLFLGVFMVVVSSAVLAASQWRQFPPTGQYAILFSYTLAFWGASTWARRQSSLQLTARMLQITTLLIIPVNFWMIDGFRLWKDTGGMILAAIAVLILTLITQLTLQTEPTSLPAAARWSERTSALTGLNSLALSWLHLGWGWPGVPLLATYIGTIGTAWVLFYQSRPTPPEAQATPRLSLGTIAVAFGTLLLLGRALWVALVPLSQLGLAIAICGWLLIWLSRHQRARTAWTQAGWGLLVTGWVIAIATTNYWQGLAISGLGIWLLADRLQRHWQLADFTALLGVGVQTTWLVWLVIPVTQQQSLLNLAGQWAGVQGLPESLLALWFFPDIVVTLYLAHRFRTGQHLSLALQAELLALGLGCVLTVISLGNPVVRSLTLLFSMLTLVVVFSQRRQFGNGWFYLLQMVGLATVASWLDVGFPLLSRQTWGGLVLIAMLLEWGFTAWKPGSRWHDSSWHLGLALAGLSYLLLWSPTAFQAESGGLIWLLTPIALTALSWRPAFPQPALAAWLSTIALLLEQPFTIAAATPRLISLGLAVLLMGLNTSRLSHLVPATLTVGFGLAFGSTLIWHIYPQLPLSDWLTLMAIAILGLWILHQILRSQAIPLAQLYTMTLDGWAASLATGQLLILSLADLALLGDATEDVGPLLPSAVILTVALVYRTWQKPQEAAIYGTAWSVSALMTMTVLLTTRSLDPLAMLHLGLGLAAQVAGDWWVRRSQQPYAGSWHNLPLIYGAIGVLWGHHNFTATTGLYTLATALIGLGVGRRGPFQSLLYLSLLAVSGAANELLFYQLLQAQGGAWGDGVVLFALLAAAIGSAEQILSRWLIPYLRLTRPEIQLIAHLHWLVGSLFLIQAITLPLSDTGEWLWAGTLLLLAIYALIQGRAHAWWIYAGFWQAAVAISYLIYQHVPERGALSAWAGAIAAVIAWGLYSQPWSRWGWAATPWQYSAIGLPGVVVGATSLQIAIPSLLLVAAFYAWIAKTTDRIRWSYISLLLIDWAAFKFLHTQAVREPFWFAVILGGSLLFAAQVDPEFSAPDQRERRHLLRMVATGLIGLAALYQSDAMIQGYQPIGFILLTLGLSLSLIMAGLGLRIRAFLYVGTALFIVMVLRQLWLLIADHSLLLWAIGILIGLLFIWVAATFEARRQQMSQLLTYWMTELEAWE